MSNLPLTIPDLVCVVDLDPFGRETTSDLESLIQDLFHLLVELPGSNPDDPDAGVGVDLYLSGTADRFATLTGQIEAQFGRDDRVDSVSASVTPGDTPIINIAIGVDGAIIPLQFGWQNGNFTNLSGGGA